jgi:hypothetical protein
MSSMGNPFCTMRMLAIGVILGGAGWAAAGAQVNATKTNLVERWITNVIEVRMPVNRFVNEYHTNLVEQARTNTVDVYATNVVSRNLTNYLVFDVTRTNFFQAYQTNLRTLNLTNWTTVLVMKTNWYTQPVTNVVTLDMPASARTGTASAAPGQDSLALEAFRGAQQTTNNQVDVQLRVRWTNDMTAPLLVQQWRVEREDGTILLFGQDREFRRALPVGKYKIEVKAQRDESAPLLAALGNLAVTPAEVTLQQRMAKR